VLVVFWLVSSLLAMDYCVLLLFPQRVLSDYVLVVAAAWNKGATAD
jgi:hypothetical protein